MNPHVAIITPYYKEDPVWLQRCMHSVQQQVCDAHVTHFLVADGHPQDWIQRCATESSSPTRRVRHMALDQAHADYGNTPRAVGGLLAVSEGFDAIAFLDADNWYDADHIATCLAAAQAGQPNGPVDWVVAKRRLVRADGSVMPIMNPEDASGQLVDTSCMFLLPGAFHTVARWATMPKPMAVLGDRFMLMGLKQGGLRAQVADHATVNYLCTYAAFFQALGETPPPYAKSALQTEALTRWLYSLTPEALRLAQRLAGVRFNVAPSAGKEHKGKEGQEGAAAAHQPSQTPSQPPRDIPT